MLVLNYKNFDNDGSLTRHGSEKDVMEITEVFSSFGFSVVEKNDLGKTVFNLI